ncbi:MAG: tryptophan--tRNA ligase [Candidatus Pacearchaeota archaeon]|nr:tryptophan--tRNA ligase [Candidatus Pacearchaeota archaeon]
MDLKKLEEDNKRLVEKFGAVAVSNLKEIPDFYTFKKRLIYSHRGFDRFFSALKKGEKCAIVSGFNASGTIHLGHKPVFDTNLFFQKKYGIPVFIPISDDESYVAGKVKNQEEALKYSLELAKELLAYGFDPKKTYFIIDQIYTNIYNLAIKLSKKINLSEIKATYGYTNEENIGLHFYPAVQAAHILFPQEKFGIKNVLVPIGPDEDAHIRISRDIARREGYTLPSILHIFFLPGIDGEKMSKSKNNAIFFTDSPEEIKKKVNKAFSGGRDTAEEQKKYGANPDIDISCIYLTRLFLDEKEGKKLTENYKSGKILTKDVKQKLAEELIKFTKDFQEKLKKINLKELDKSILKN